MSAVVVLAACGPTGAPPRRGRAVRRDGFAVTEAEAIPLHVQVDPGGGRVVPADPAAFARVAAVVDSRGAQASGLHVVSG